MLNQRTFWLATFLLGLGCVLHPGFDLCAGDKKKDEKKAEQAPLLKKSAELKPSDEKDAKRTKSPRKIYTIALAAGKTYQFDLASKDFDAYLRLEDAAGNEVAFNDDAGASTFDSRIVYKAAKAGDYKIIVMSYDARAGNFTLTVIEADKKAIVSTGSRFQGKAIELTRKDGKFGYAGELTETDNASFKRYYKLFTVELEKGKTYRIESRPDDPKTFDAYLFLEDSDGVLLDSAGPGGENRQARIVYMATRAGAYRIIASTARTDQTGKFALEVGPAAKEAK
jgi:hypothetical protein